MRVMRHPIQPVGPDKQGVMRFKANNIVRHLLDNGGIDMNQLAMLPFSDEDREQFAQLIGYSLAGYSSLSYASDATYGAAERMVQEGLDEKDARISQLEDTLAETRAGIRKAAAALFRIHPDDLHE